MWVYIARRLLALPLVLLGVSVLVFLALHLAPGDPAQIMLGEVAPREQLERLRQELGLDQPLVVQYVRWLGRLVQLDLGRSIRSNRPVVEEIGARIPATAQLAATAVAVAVAIGVTAGVVSARRANTWVDQVVTVVAMAGVAMPVFWQALMLILLFSVYLGWLPPSGRLGGWQYLVLPAVTLGTSAAAAITRMTRSTMLEVLGLDFIRTARAKGVSEARVFFHHALRNALVPVVTIVGLEFGSLMAGAVITETVFAWPGVGRLVVDAIRSRDLPVVQGCVLFFAASYALINLVVDVTYALLDPRIRYG